MGDSDGSTASSDSGLITGTIGETLSIVAEFDDLIRCVRQQRCDEVEDAFLHFAEQVEPAYGKLKEARDECRRLQELLDKRTHEFSDLESKLHLARHLLDKEKKNTKVVMEERDAYKIQLNRVREMVFKEYATSVPESTREKFSFLNEARYSSDGHGFGLSAIKEVNTTGSLLSDFSYSRSEDDIDKSLLENGVTWKKHRPSTGGEPAFKKRRSSSSKAVEISHSDTVRATTTVVVPKEGPITATSVIESLPQQFATTQQFGATPKRKVFETCLEEHDGGQEEVQTKWQRGAPSNRTPSRASRAMHTFQPKIVVMPENCGPCDKRMRFGRTAMKCKDCKALCHPECKDDLPLPCIPQINTPTNRNLLGTIGDFTPTTSPMVPAIIVHCVNEIESKGLQEVGIYRVPGAERDVKALKERFIRGKGSPCLTEIDIHVICGTIKDFLRSLQEPLVSYRLWRDFVQAVEASDMQDTFPGLYQAISELPQPNRDTLAFLILHFKKVARSIECKMPIENLAKVFGPTIVGYSTPDPSPSSILTETRQQVQVMECLLNLPSDYWEQFGCIESCRQIPSTRMQQTPSTDSLLRPNIRGLFLPKYSKRTPRKFFPTPPYNKK